MGIHMKNGINYSGSGESSKHTYSTEEQVVGTWVDGSTVYEKTLHISKSSISSGTNAITHNIPNFGYAINVEGWVLYNNDYSNPLPITSLNSDWIARVYDFFATGFTFEIGSGAFSATTDIYVTIRYTKTTTS